MPTRRELEEIDRIVDEVVSDREKAEKLKEELHRNLWDEPGAEAEEAGEVGEEEDDADLWDNVPV